MTAPTAPIAQECVEGYLYAAPPLELLLFRRPPARGRIWVPVSGKVEPSDRSYEAALRRELSEETGLTDPARVDPLDWAVTFPMEGALWRLHAYAVKVDRSFVPRLSSEHDASAWLPTDAAIARLHYDDNRAAVRRLAARLSGAAPNV
ncbi:MAG TPA: NUDIX domain-containing protein [Thermoplasmata archaeon]|nr:NUDIX domain-containing protein [Thermoplasmata archaeon]